MYIHHSFEIPAGKTKPRFLIFVNLQDKKKEREGEREREKVFFFFSFSSVT